MALDDAKARDDGPNRRLAPTGSVNISVGSVKQSRKPSHECGELAWIDQKIRDDRNRGQNEKPISHGRTPESAVSPDQLCA